ncbi:hypothetical protein BDR07DRAFT_1380813 [Suillus spraguei]|nr:hypothetical protein BDR07DRAFT_1380813 [Suillus spraguei]
MGIQEMKGKVTFEEVEDEDTTPLTNNGQYFETQPDASWVLHEGETPFEELRREQHEEWGLAQWLVKNLGQAQTDQFLKLPIASMELYKMTMCGNHENENGESLQEEVEL